MLLTITIVEDDKTFASLMKKMIDADDAFSCTAIYNSLGETLTHFIQQH